MNFDHPIRVKQAESTGHRDNGRSRGQRSRDDDEQPQRRAAQAQTAVPVRRRGRNAQRLEIRQERQVEAESGSRDRQSGAQDDVRGPAEHRVIGRFSVLTGLTSLLVATDKKDRVIGSRRDRQRGQHGDDERREPQQTIAPEKRDEPAYVQLNLAGNQGSTQGNESVKAVRDIIDNSTPPKGLKVHLTGPAALITDMNQAADKSMFKMMGLWPCPSRNPP